MTQPAKKAAKKAAATPLALDVLKGLSVSEAPAPQRPTATVSAADNPAVAWLRDSWDKKTAEINSTGGTKYVGAGKRVVVPTPNAGQVESLIRKAAVVLSNELDARIGTAVRRNDNPPEDPKRPNGKRLVGQTEILFAAVTGKDPYTRKATKAALAAQAAPQAPATEQQSVNA